jgi:hypothetical protein
VKGYRACQSCRRVTSRSSAYMYCRAVNPGGRRLMAGFLRQLRAAASPASEAYPNGNRRHLVPHASHLLHSLLLPLVSRVLTTFFSWSRRSILKRTRHSSMPIFWPLIGPYLVWIFFFDKAPGRGGRTSMWFRRWRVWKHFAGELF